MGTCKTCRWWSGPIVDPDEHFNPYGYAKCSHVKVDACAEDKYPDGCTDSEGYGGVFTGPDFGCIHHEQK